jgi:hypothetical protein
VCVAEPAAAASATDVNVKVDGLKIQSGRTTITFGDRDKRGYCYCWDGKERRDPEYWEKHHGKGKGQQCPPGQAKKGNC